MAAAPPAPKEEGHLATIYHLDRDARGGEPPAGDLDGEDEPVVAGSLPDDDDDALRSPRRERPEDIEAAADEAVEALIANDGDDATDDDSTDDDDLERDPLQHIPLEGVDERWRLFVRQLHESRGGWFRIGRPRKIGETVEVCFDNVANADAARRFGADEAVLKALHETFGPTATLTVLHESDPTTSIKEAEDKLRAQIQADLEAHAKTHPIVQKAVTLFGGEVKLVRRRPAGG